MPFLIGVTFLSCGCANKNPNLYEEQYPDGSLKLSVEKDDQGQKHGIEMVYWANGNLKNLNHWSHGILDGNCQEYYESGRVAVIGHITNGIQDSVLTEYFEDGQVKSTCDYANNATNGECVFYYRSGGKKLIAGQKNNETTWFIHYDSISGKSDDYRVPPSSVTPDTLSISQASPLRVTLLEPTLTNSFSASRVDYYLSTDAQAMQKPTYTVPGRVENDQLVFDLPTGIKPGNWVLDIVIVMSEASPKAAGFGMGKVITVVK